jgi:pimeloyl-ACP methyl ester carboxylesterase
MDHYADDLAAVTTHLDLKDAIHVGHSTGGGEVVHYLARHGESRVAKAAIISAVPPLMMKTEPIREGCPRTSSTVLRHSLLPIARSSTERSPPARSTTTIGRARNPRNPSSRTGGARA